MYLHLCVFFPTGALICAVTQPDELFAQWLGWEAPGKKRLWLTNESKHLGSVSVMTEPCITAARLCKRIRVGYVRTSRADEYTRLLNCVHFAYLRMEADFNGIAWSAYRPLGQQTYTIVISRKSSRLVTKLVWFCCSVQTKFTQRKNIFPVFAFLQ